MHATLTYDPDVKTLYIQLTDADVLETVELAEGVYLDVDRDGEPVGFEILHAEPTLLAGLPARADTTALRELVKRPAGAAPDALPIPGPEPPERLTLATARTDPERAAVVAEIKRLAREIHAEMPKPWRSRDHGDLLYGNDGLPA